MLNSESWATALGPAKQDPNPEFTIEDPPTPGAPSWVRSNKVTITLDHLTLYTRNLLTASTYDKVLDRLDGPPRVPTITPSKNISNRLLLETCKANLGRTGPLIELLRGVGLTAAVLDATVVTRGKFYTEVDTGPWELNPTDFSGNLLVQISSLARYRYLTDPVDAAIIAASAEDAYKIEKRNNVKNKTPWLPPSLDVYAHHSDPMVSLMLMGIDTTALCSSESVRILAEFLLTVVVSGYKYPRDNIHLNYLQGSVHDKPHKY